MTGLAFTDQLQNKKQANQSETNTRYTQAITWSWIWLIWNGASVIAACFAFAACVLAALTVWRLLFLPCLPPVGLWPGVLVHVLAASLRVSRRARGSLGSLSTPANYRKADVAPGDSPR